MNVVKCTGIVAVADTAVRNLIVGSAQQIPGLRVVGEARDGRQALELVLQHAPDIAVLDVLMPLCNGKEILEEVRRRELQTRVLLTTGHDCQDYFMPAFWGDALGFLYRGDGLEDWIVPALKAVISGRPFVSPTPLEILRKQHASLSNRPEALSLSGPEIAILKLTVRGKSDKEMAKALNLPVRTIEKRKARLRRKIGVNSTVELAVYAVTRRLFDGDEVVKKKTMS